LVETDGGKNCSRVFEILQWHAMSNQYRLFEVRRVQCRTSIGSNGVNGRAVYTFPRHRDSLHELDQQGTSDG
jgi:hypothetical protein